MEVESTIRPAKGRIAGFEGREGHRTPFAPALVYGPTPQLQTRAASIPTSCVLFSALTNSYSAGLVHTS